MDQAAIIVVLRIPALKPVCPTASQRSPFEVRRYELSVDHKEVMMFTEYAEDHFKQIEGCGLPPVHGMDRRSTRMQMISARSASMCGGGMNHLHALRLFREQVFMKGDSRGRRLH